MKHFVWRQIIPSLLCLVLLPAMTVAALLCVHVRVNGAGRELLPLAGPWLETGFSLLQPVVCFLIAVLLLWGRRFLRQNHHRLKDLAALTAFMAGGLVEVDWFLATPGLLTFQARCWQPLPRPLLWMAFFLLLNSLLLTIHAAQTGSVEPAGYRAYRHWLEIIILLPFFVLIQFHPLHQLAVENPDPEQAVFVAETRILNALDRYQHFTGLPPDNLNTLVVSGFLERIPWNPRHPEGEWKPVRNRNGRITSVRDDSRQYPSSIIIFQIVQVIQQWFRELLLGVIVLLLMHHLLLIISRIRPGKNLELLLLLTELSYFATILLLALGSRPLWVIMTGATWPVG